MRRVAVAVPRNEHKVLRAVVGGDHRLVEEYIEEGVEMTVHTAMGHSVLHVAAARGLANVLRVLLVVPEVVELKDDQDDEGRTALWLAAANGELVCLLFQVLIALPPLQLLIHRYRSPCPCCSTAGQALLLQLIMERLHCT